MTRPHRVPLVAVLAALALLAALVLTAVAASVGSRDVPTAEAAVAAKPKVLHRVVWDARRKGRKGIHLRSANLDGTDVTKVYDTPRGFTLNPTLDRRGRRVAFSTCCRDDLPPLVVARVTGGKALEPLAGHPEIEFVGGVGWSPDGRRLAFEGTTSKGHEVVHSLWTVRPSGSGLRRVLTLGGKVEPIINDALAWTEDGILYSDGKDLRIADDGRSRRVLRHASSVHISGDGRRLVLVRHVRGKDGLYVSRADGTGATRVVTFADPGAPAPLYYGPFAPSHDGRSILTYRVDYPDRGEVVTWRVGKGVDTATAVDVVGTNDVATWN